MSFSQAILPILCEIFAFDYFPNRKMLKFDKEITKAKMLQHILMDCSCEFLATQ